MRSLLGRFHRPNARSQTERLFMLNNLGDGSTLSLDFTTGVLDSRLTLERSTNATFINSQGYVQFAAANMFVNSAWTDANNLPAGWTFGAGTGSVSRSNETRTLTCAAQQYWWYQQPASRTGLTYSVSVEVTAVSGTILYGDIILAGSSTTIAWYKDGVLQASGSSTPVTTGVITLIFTANSDNTILRLGLGSAGTNVTGSVTLRYPQFQQGQVPLRSYYENTSTSVARFNSARFDYNPTTTPPTPRGLLIEGSATNLAVRSDDFNTTVSDGTQWIASGYTAGTLSTTLPDGTTGNARRISMASGSGSLRSSTITVTASTAYTFSFWARNNGGSQARFRVWNVTAGSSIVDYTQSVNNYVSQIGGANNTSSTWVRVSVQFTTPAGCTAIYVYPCSSDSGTVDLLIWGAQVEAGSGASSYIPTGASQATRNRDELTLTNLSSIAFSQTSGTAFAHVEVREKATGTFIPYGSFDTSGGGRCWWWLRHNRDASAGTRVLGNVFNSGGSTAITTSNYQYNSGNGGLVKFATSLDTAASSVVYVIGGASPQTTTASAFTLATAARWSVNINSDVAATDLGSMWMRSFKYWPTNLPNATLQSLTT